MSNTVKLRKMAFTDANGTVTWGWTVQDNYGSFFDDTLEQEDLLVQGINFLRLVVLRNTDRTCGNEQPRDLLITCWQHEKGLYIDGLFYEYEAIRPILEELL